LECWVDPIQLFLVKPRDRPMGLLFFSKSGASHEFWFPPSTPQWICDRWPCARHS